MKERRRERGVKPSDSSGRRERQDKKKIRASKGVIGDLLNGTISAPDPQSWKEKEVPTIQIF